jgi:hypothetical protein
MMDKDEIDDDYAGENFNFYLFFLYSCDDKKNANNPNKNPCDAW